MTRGKSTPLVLGILALKLFLNLRVPLAPESLQICRDLDRTVVWRKNLDPEWNPPAAHAKTARRVEKILNPSSNHRHRPIPVRDFRGAAARQFDPFRREIVERLLLRSVQPRFYDQPDGSFLDLLVAYRPLANLLEKEQFFGFIDSGEFQLRKFDCDKIYPGDPLLDRVVPMLERTTSCQGLACQEARGFRIGPRENSSLLI